MGMNLRFEENPILIVLGIFSPLFFVLMSQALLAEKSRRKINRKSSNPNTGFFV